jgi:hypothetical protein
MSIARHSRAPASFATVSLVVCEYLTTLGGRAICATLGYSATSKSALSSAVHPHVCSTRRADAHHSTSTSPADVSAEEVIVQDADIAYRRYGDVVLIHREFSIRLGERANRRTGMGHTSEQKARMALRESSWRIRNFTCAHRTHGCR